MLKGKKQHFGLGPSEKNRREVTKYTYYVYSVILDDINIYV